MSRKISRDWWYLLEYLRAIQTLIASIIVIVLSSVVFFYCAMADACEVTFGAFVTTEKVKGQG